MMTNVEVMFWKILCKTSKLSPNTSREQHKAASQWCNPKHSSPSPSHFHFTTAFHLQLPAKPCAFLFSFMEVLLTVFPTLCWEHSEDHSSNIGMLMVTNVYTVTPVSVNTSDERSPAQGTPYTGRSEETLKHAVSH